MKRLFKLFVWVIASIFVGSIVVGMFFALGGCLPLPKIRAGQATVTATKDAGKPAELKTSTAESVTDIPAGSRVTIVKTEATPATEAQAAQPAKEVRTVEFAAPAQIRETVARVDANTGTVDTSVAKHRIDVEDRRWLLFVAIGCAVGGLVVKSMLPEWPGISHGLLLGAGVAFAAWKLADIPAWLWAVGLGVTVLLALGYKRAEWDKNKDGIPDALQK